MYCLNMKIEMFIICLCAIFLLYVKLCVLYALICRQNINIIKQLYIDEI